MLLSLLLIHPVSNAATVEEDVAALDVRVTDNETAIGLNNDLLINLVNYRLIYGQRLDALESSTVDTYSTRVRLQQSCTEGNAPVDNCFTSSADLLVWLENAAPTSPAGIAVEIGTGTFGSIYCKGNWNISLRGAGREQTTIQGGISYGNLGIAIMDNCQLNVQDLTIRDNGNSITGAITATGTGSSTTWSNVDVFATNYGWTDSLANVTSKHFWFNSRITATADGANKTFAKAYRTASENWFFATQLIAIADINTGSVIAVDAIDGAEVHVYGGNIRAIAEPGIIVDTSTSPGLVAVSAIGNSEVHVHGTGIDVISDAANDIIALYGGGGSLIHANSSSYALKTGAQGSVARIINVEDSSDIKASYTWEQSSNPPQITSVTGADVAIETDCSDTGCQTPGEQPHMLLYSEKCAETGDPWFDIVMKACR